MLLGRLRTGVRGLDVVPRLRDGDPMVLIIVLGPTVREETTQRIVREAIVREEMPQ